MKIEEGCEEGDEIPVNGEEFTLDLYLYVDFHLWGEDADENAEELVTELFGMIFTRLAAQIDRG
ncbi:hypothetical protein L0U85_09420 [Glycomyces sp. L485]|uniref:hypothetical protein n=1 Tax=Glycomyces sp. L485 TaxID=2909235 RepID=UPI001F4A73AA|nr:hypothetical protein [Glycomyces sp. L485]MCH7231069.1 hypothetical protein [Glycomyces sp. L485]